jgi:hypothetical protein
MIWKISDFVWNIYGMKSESSMRGTDTLMMDDDY